MSRWSRVRAVVRREYLERVRTKAFLFSTFGIPVLMLALFAVPLVIGAGSETGDPTVAVVDRTGVLYERVAPALEEAGYRVERGAAGSDAGEREEERLVEGEISGYLVLDSASLDRGRVVFRSGSEPGRLRRLLLRQTTMQAILDQRLAGEGGGGDELLAGGSLEVEVLGEEGRVSDSEPRFWVGYAAAFVLYMLVLLHAVAVMRSVLEEKTSRIVEVVISSLRPWELMLGKVLGVGAVGLTQFAVWVLFGVGIAVWGLPAAMAALGPEVLGDVDLAGALPGLGFLVFFALLFLLGFFLYAALYAAVGAMCSREEEAQQAQFPVVILLIVPLMLLTPVLGSPTAGWAVALSLVPFFAPVLLVARMGVGAVALWEMGVALVLLAAAILGVAWLAGRIYRVGILMQGKRPTLPELWRWVREA